MNIKGDSYTVELTNNTIRFTGKLDKSDYSDVIDYLKNAEQSIPGNEIVLDLKDLVHLNSSGIRGLAIFIKKCPKKIIIYANKELTWQRIGIIPLSKIKEEVEIVL